MKTTNRVTIDMTKDEVQEAIRMWLSTKETTLLHISDIDMIVKRTQIPGGDPHDCDWREEFDGIQVKGY